ncbi:MAG: hypothetical protein FWC73_13245 [Defluviitaleaceae bacterium]|nr:hypothetical protein [Defluviitaleaceae bacterium]
MRKKYFACLLLSIALLVSSIPVFASRPLHVDDVSSISIDENLIRGIDYGLEEVAMRESYVLEFGFTDLNVILHDITVTIDESRLTREDHYVLSQLSMDEFEFANLLNNAYAYVIDMLSDFQAGVQTAPIDTWAESDSFATQFSSTNSFRRVGSVWAGVPAIGHAYINIGYTVTTRSTPASFISGTVDSSWRTGVSVFSWTHNRGFVDASSGKTADVHAVGVLHAGISISVGFISVPANIAVNATFLYIDRFPR